MPKLTPKALCRMAIMAALYVLLNMVSIRAGNLRITFASLPVVVSALLFGPWEGVLVALLGELCNQMLSYGFTATTVLWLIPPAVRGLVIGLAAASFWRRGQPLESRPITCYLVCLFAAVATTLANTLFIWLDSVIYGYYTFAYVFGSATLRFVSGMATAVVIATVVMPLVSVLRRQGLVQRA